jgi:membrane protein
MMVVLSLFVVVALLFLGFGKLAISVLDNQDIITDQITLFWLTSVRWIIIILFTLLSFSMLYYFGQPKDRQQNKYQFFSAGATLATILFVVGGLLIKGYFENFARYNILYGSIGSIIIIMIWLYYNSIILLIGFELNASIRQSRAEKSKYTIIT